MSCILFTKPHARPPDPSSPLEIPKAQPVLAVLANKRSSVLGLGKHVYAKINSENGRPSGQPQLSLGNTIYGGNHVLVPIQVDGTVVFYLKVPMTGTKEAWDRICQRSLETEAQTMRLLHGFLPVPKVYDYSSKLDNAIGCPYIAIAHVAGSSLYDVWYGHQLHPGTISLETTRQCRLRALDGIAKAMVELGRFAFAKAGALDVDNHGSIVGIGPSRFIDARAMQEEEPCQQEAQVARGFYKEWGPTTDPKQFYTRAMDPDQAHKYSKGVETLLRMLIDWMPEPGPSGDPHSAEQHPFVLAHPDFDVQNFLVAEDGTLVAMIDWDGVEVVPRSVGNEVLPGWLTRDWDPVMYMYESKMGDEEELRRGYEPETLWEDSEETLAEYREIYAQLIAKHAGQHAARAASVARRSLISENLEIAASQPVCRSRILEKIISEMWDAYRDGEADSTESGCGEESESESESKSEAESDSDSESEESEESESDLYPSFYDIAQMYFYNEVQQDLLERLEQAFKALLHKLDSHIVTA